MRAFLQLKRVQPFLNIDYLMLHKLIKMENNVLYKNMPVLLKEAFLFTQFRIVLANRFKKTGIYKLLQKQMVFYFNIWENYYVI